LIKTVAKCPPWSHRLKLILLTLILFANLADAQTTFTATLRRVVNSRSNPSQLWASTERTLYRSDDQGRTYRAIIMRPDLAQQPVISEIRVDHRNAGVILVATQDPAAPLLRSTDTGATWSIVRSAIPQTPPTGSFEIMTLQPTEQLDVYYVQIVNQLLKSTDGGATVSALRQLPGSGRLAIANSDPRIMYLQSAATTSGLITSTDEGQTWRNTAPLSPGTVPRTILSSTTTIIINPRVPTQLFGYFFVEYADPGASNGRSFAPNFYRSSDGGNTWLHQPLGGFVERISTSIDGNLLLIAGQQSFRSTDFGTTLSAIANVGPFFVNAADANRVLTSTHESTDGGRTFTTLAKRHFPLPRTGPPISQTLETGTSNPLLAKLVDTDGTALRLDALTFQSSVPWLNAQTAFGFLDEVQFQVAANTLTAGQYDGTMQVTSADFSAPAQVAVRLTVTDKVEPQLRYRYRLAAGNGTAQFSGDGGPAPQAGFEEYIASVSSGGGSVMVATKTRVRRINANGTIETIAGSVAGRNGFGDGGPATAARFALISSITVDRGQVYVVDGGDQRIRLIRTDGTIQTFYQPASGSLLDFISSTGRIRVNARGEVFYGAAFVGILRWDGMRFSPVVRGTFLWSNLVDFQFDAQGDIVAAELTRLLRVRASGEQPTVLGGTAANAFSGDHQQVATATFQETDGLAIDSAGNIFVLGAGRVRCILPTGIVQTVIGNGDAALALTTGDAANTAGFGSGTTIHVDERGVIYVGLFGRRVLAFERLAVVPPRISNGGVVSLAAAARRVAPGAIFSIYGADLAPATATNTSVPLPRLLSGVQVLVNGAPVPLFFVSAGQINAQMPYALPPGPARVVVSRDGALSGDQTVEIAAAQPDILVYGANRAVAVNPNGAINGTGQGAAAGEIVVVYLTGIGALDTPVAAGAASPSSPLARVAAPASASIGGTSAELLFLGLAPGFVGLAQANVRIPEAIMAGDRAFIITAGGAASNSVVLTVR
jgi:uncharacterized protein (TIGR03437 family)